MSVPAELEGGNGHAVAVVVDDDPGYLKAMVLTIERSDLDLEVVEAATGVDALLEIGRVQPSLIVLDYSLPDLNASQVIQRLLEPGRRLDAEVMVVTGGMPVEAAVELRRMGVKVILNKSEGMPAVVDGMREGVRRGKGGEGLQRVGGFFRLGGGRGKPGGPFGENAIKGPPGP